jgi:hypothetical protein
MADQGDGNTTSVGIKRLGRPATTTADELGPLADLVGTWIGTGGWELMAVPSGDGFRLIVRPYVEIITFSALGAPVPDRGGPVPDIFISGVMYNTRIADAESDEPLHLETGMWFYLGESQEPLQIARSSTIPHGDALLALGTYETIAGPPPITSHSALPTVGPEPPLGYTDPYLQPVTFGGVSFNTADPQKVLTDVLATQTVVSTTTLSVDTQSPGGILNIPYVDKNANASAFSSVFWIETIEDATTGDQFMQLQYSQITTIEFLPQFGNPSERIIWPHVNVATLHKQ